MAFLHTPNVIISGISACVPKEIEENNVENVKICLSNCDYSKNAFLEHAKCNKKAFLE